MDVIQVCQLAVVQVIKFGLKTYANVSVQRIWKNQQTIVEANGGMIRCVHASADPDVHKVVARVSSNGSKSHAHVNVQLIRLNQQHVVIKNHGTMTVARVNANLKCQAVDVHAINNGTVKLANVNALRQKNVLPDNHGTIKHVNVAVQPLEHAPVHKNGVQNNANASVQPSQNVHHHRFGIQTHAAANVQRTCNHQKEVVMPVVSGMRQHVPKNVQSFQIVNRQWSLIQKHADVNVEINQIHFQMVKFGAIRNVNPSVVFHQFQNVNMIITSTTKTHANVIVRRN